MAAAVASLRAAYTLNLWPDKSLFLLCRLIPVTTLRADNTYKTLRH